MLPIKYIRLSGKPVEVVAHSLARSFCQIQPDKISRRKTLDLWNGQDASAAILIHIQIRLLVELGVQIKIKYLNPQFHPRKLLEEAIHHHHRTIILRILSMERLVGLRGSEVA